MYASVCVCVSFLSTRVSQASIPLFMIKRGRATEDSSVREYILISVTDPNQKNKFSLFKITAN